MRKPIVVLFLPENDKFNRKLPDRFFDEYWVLVMRDPERKSCDIKVFSDKDIEPIELKKLQDIFNINNETQNINDNSKA